MSEDGKAMDEAMPSLADEEDLPPGVRKHNRCHSSSESDSEDEKDKKPTEKAGDSSDSDSDGSTKKEGEIAKKTEAAIPEDPASTAKEKDEGSAKTKRSRSRSGSRSKSRSRSASPKKRRSSEKSSRRSRSRSRDRRHKKDRKRRSHRSRSRERRRSRDRNRHKKDHRRSRSRSRDRRDRHRDRSSRDKRRRSRSRSRRSRSRDRRRSSRSPSPAGKFGDKVIKPGASFGRPAFNSSTSKPLTFKEKMRQELIQAIEDGADTTNNSVLASKGSTLCTQSAGIQQQAPKPRGPPVPLMDAIITTAITPAGTTITPSEAVMQSMLALQKQTTEKTGIEIPKYYNPAAINPMKYAEQVQKRKLLWSKAKDKDVNSQWHATSLSGDADDKSKEKFRKLMGIKEDSATGEGDGGEKQKQIFEQLNKEYEFARMTTHTHRGVGLGFGSVGFQPQSVPQPPPQPQPPPSDGPGV